MLDELISRRFNSGLTTLFATNYLIEAAAVAEQPGRVVRTRTPEFQREAESMTLSQRVGDRIYSRLCEMCAFQQLDPGMDLRKDRRSGNPFYR
jgi:DNA replication protein DnaC